MYIHLAELLLRFVHHLETGRRNTKCRLVYTYAYIYIDLNVYGNTYTCQHIYVCTFR